MDLEDRPLEKNMSIPPMGKTSQEEIPNRRGIKKPTNRMKNRGVVTLPYIRGVTKRIQRTMRKYTPIHTPVKPCTKLQHP